VAPENEEYIEKSITTGDLIGGGQLNPAQQQQFVTLVKRFSVLLPLVRFVRMPRPMMDVDKLWVGEPVTESVDEATDTTNLSQPKFQRITLIAKKLRSAWNITTEVLQGNIEQNDFETTVMNAFVERIATDLEDLAINGDTTYAGTDLRGRLIRRLDGWDIQTNASHIIDARGRSIQKGLFSESLRRMPKQYKNDPGLRWLVSDAIAVDWVDITADRGTIGGDLALQGAEIGPLGHPMVKIPLIEDEQNITVTTAVPAELKGTEFGPFSITAANDTLILSLDAGAGVNLVTITLPHGVIETSRVAQAINNALVADVNYGLAYEAVARDDRMGRMVLTSPVAGAASHIYLHPVPVGQQAYTTLGLIDGVPVGANWPNVTVEHDGAAAGTNEVPEGSFFWLVNPRNFIWGILDGTRIFSEFNKNTDQIETVIYNQVDARVENVDAVVKVKNVRRRTLAL